MSSQALEAGSCCRNITLEVVFFLCSSFPLGAETVAKSFLVWSGITEKILWICCFSKAVSTQRLLQVCLVVETLSRMQEGKTSLTSLWSNIAADQLETGSSNNPKWIILGSIPNCWRGRKSFYPGHLSPSIPVPHVCLQEQPFSGVFPHTQGGRLCPGLHVEPSSSFVQFQVFQAWEWAGMSLTYV